MFVIPECKVDTSDKILSEIYSLININFDATSFEMLLNNLNVNIDYNNYSILKTCIDNNNYDFIHYLADNNFDFSVCDNIAIKLTTSVRIMQILIENGVDIHVDNEFALKSAVFRNNIECFDLLIQSGADISAAGEEILLLAIDKIRQNQKHFHILEKILSSGFNINLNNSYLINMALCRSVDIEFIEFLLINGANINQITIHTMAGVINRRMYEHVKLLGDWGYDFSIINKHTYCDDTKLVDMYNYLIGSGVSSDNILHIISKYGYVKDNN